MKKPEPIDVECWIVDQDPAGKRRLNSTIAAVLTHPGVWLLAFVIAVVGLTEGL